LSGTIEFVVCARTRASLNIYFGSTPDSFDPDSPNKCWFDSENTNKKPAIGRGICISCRRRWWPGTDQSDHGLGRAQHARRGQARDGLHQSNHRINVGSIPNTQIKNPPSGGVSVSPAEGDGGQGRNRTIDTRIFSPLLYQLSYLAILSNCRAGSGGFSVLAYPVAIATPLPGHTL
jgi:hypothetical protein